MSVHNFNLIKNGGLTSRIVSLTKKNNYCHQKHCDNLQQFYIAAELVWSATNLFQD